MNNLSYEEALREYEGFKSQKLSLNMARGKPSPAQLDMSSDFLVSVTKDNCVSSEGIDVRNYGCLEGLAAARKLMAQVMGIAYENVVIGGLSSLTVMYDTLTRLLITKPVDGDKPWFENKNRKFICPAPGYDRHFQMTEALGFKLIPVEMHADGPDMDAVEKLAASDPDVLGIWCVPKYSNPTGAVYSRDVCERLAKMPTAAPDFKIFWDNAYAVHHLDPAHKKAEIPNILELTAQHGHKNRVFCFSSTSKVVFAGGGIAAMGTSDENLAWFKAQAKYQMICTDKINQQRHVVFFPDFAALERHMAKLAAILKPKFDMFENILAEELQGIDGVSWTKPCGGYFIGLTLPKHTAKRVHELSKEAGLTLTPAGNTHPYNHDPDDAFLRIAPSYPSLAEIEQAAKLLCAAVKLACAEQNK